MIALLLFAALCFGQQGVRAGWLPLVKPASGGGGGPSVKQVAHNTQTTTVTTVTATFASGISAGSIIAVASAWNGNTVTGTITDGSSDTVTDSGAGVLTDGNNNRTQVQAFLAPTAGTTTVTLTTNSVSAFSNVTVWEIAGYTGSVTFDQVATANGLNSNTTTTGALAQANEVGITYASNSNTSFTPSSLTVTPGTYTFDFNDTAPATASVQSGHVVTSTTSALTASITISFNYMMLWMVTFK